MNVGAAEVLAETATVDNGTKQTFAASHHFGRFWTIADIERTSAREGLSASDPTATLLACDTGGRAVTQQEGRQ